VDVRRQVEGEIICAVESGFVDHAARGCGRPEEQGESVDGHVFVSRREERDGLDALLCGVRLPQFGSVTGDDQREQGKIAPFTMRSEAETRLQ
jgi:hypothetical protein